MKRLKYLIALLLIMVMMLPSCSLLEEIGVDSIGEWFEDMFEEIADGLKDDAKDEACVDEIIIIDASASMQATCYEETRFERAVCQAHLDAQSAIEAGNRVSIIIAANQPYVVIQQKGASELGLVHEAFDKLLSDNSDYCYSAADIEGAISMANMIAPSDGQSNVTLYTDTPYTDIPDVNVCTVTDPSEWNAAVLDVRAYPVEGYYRVEIDVASYKNDSVLDVLCHIVGANQEATLSIEATAYCLDSEICTLVFAHIPKKADDSEVMSDMSDMSDIYEDITLYSYDYIHVSIAEKDSLEFDNEFYFYGERTDVSDGLSFGLEKVVYEVGDPLVLDAECDLEITKPDGALEFSAEHMPAEVVLNVPGVYTISWTDELSGEMRVINIYVKIPVSESSAFYW